MQISLSHITFSYPHADHVVLNDVSLTFTQGWTGIAGDNGCGKSTLAKIVAGTLHADSGHVIPHLACAYCPQGSGLATEDLDAFTMDWSGDAIRLRDRLSIEDDWMYSYDDLSFGQKRRVQIACAISKHPDVLILDEPTNHVDIATKDAVLQALKTYKGIGILISHDQDLLNDLVTSCVLFTFRGARMFKGTYAQASATYQEGISADKDKKRDARNVAKRLASERQRRAEEAARSNARRSKRGLDEKDHDARAKIGLAIVSGKDARATHASRIMADRARTAERDASAIFVPKRYDGSIHAYGARSTRSTVAEIPEGWIPFGNDVRDPVDKLEDGVSGVHIPRAMVGPAEKIALVGPNGAGKSTIVRLIHRAIESDVPMLYIPQEVSASQQHALIKHVRSLSPQQRGRIMSQVAQLNSDPDEMLSGANVSPGELRKLAIAYGGLSDPEVLLLDEPTNHLDIHSVEMLERFLQAFPGCVIMVSHDMHVVRSVCDRIWKVTPHRKGDVVRSTVSCMML